MGDSPELGWTLLNLLALSGWSIAVTTAFAAADLDENETLVPVPPEQPAVLVIAHRGGYDIRRTGSSVAQVAPDVFQEAVSWQRLRIDRDVQLQIPA